MASAIDTPAHTRLRTALSGGVLRLTLSGDWTLARGLPPLSQLDDALEDPHVTSLAFDAAAIDAWDAGLITFLYGVSERARRRKLSVDPSGLPDGARRLLGLAMAVPPRDVEHARADDALTARVGRVAIHAWDTVSDALTFQGEMVLAFGALLRGRARFRAVDLLQALEGSGVAALGIVALINFLIGAVLAFVGAVQLVQFGATIYVANLVAIGITRELASLMTGIVMAGRTGAAYAAVLGTMTVNEEVDALRTMGFRPLEFLVLPRVLATALMMPALVAYADALGMLGGMFVGVAVLGQGTVEYLTQTASALELRHVMIGLGKSVVFGGIVALTGCYYGLRVERSSAGVGAATTKAVVNSIVLLVVADAIFTVVLHMVGL